MEKKYGEKKLKAALMFADRGHIPRFAQQRCSFSNWD
jgi:hypothetical protein